MNDKVLAETTTPDGKRSEVMVDKSCLQFSVHIYAVIVKDNKILVSPQWNDNGYDFPGGRVDLGENHIDALIREVREETGFECAPSKIIDIHTSLFKHPKKDKPTHSVLIYYDADIVSGEISTDGFDEWEASYAKAARFVTLQEMKAMELMSRQEILESIIPHLERKLKTFQ